MSEGERKRHYQRVADDSAQLYEKRKAEAGSEKQIPPEKRPTRPVTRLFEKIVPPQNQPVDLGEQQQAYLKKAEEAGFDVEGVDSLPEIVDREGAQLFHKGPKKTKIPHDPIDLALLAALTLPEEYTGSVKKHRNETSEEIVFRLATGEISREQDPNMLAPSMIGGYEEDLKTVREIMDEEDPQYEAYTRDLPFAEGQTPEEDEQPVLSPQLFRKYHALFSDEELEDVDNIGIDPKIAGTLMRLFPDQDIERQLMKRLIKAKDLPLIGGETRIKFTPRLMDALIEESLKANEGHENDPEKYVSSNPEIELVDAKTRIELVRKELFIHEFFAALREGSFTAEEARGELTEAATLFKRLKIREENWIPVEEVEWLEIFRPDETKQVPQGSREEHADTTSSSPRHSSYEVRKQALTDVGLSWSSDKGDVKLLVSTFNKKRDEDTGRKRRQPKEGKDERDVYLALVLKDTIDETPGEHVVVENLERGRIFVWRAEKGIEEGELLTSWEQVFNHARKDEAHERGAWRTTHRGDWQGRVWDELTRPADELEYPDQDTSN